VAGQLRRELAQLIQQEIKDPDLGFISLSDVEVTRDLAHAKVFITVFDASHVDASMRVLKRSAGFLRSRLGQLLRMRNVPELHFVHDASVETGQRMDRLIADAVASDQAHPGADDGPGQPDPADED